MKLARRSLLGGTLGWTLGWTVIGALALISSCADASARTDLVTVERQDLLIEIDVTGKLEAVDSDTLGPPAIPRTWQFKLSMMAPEGSEVKRGDPVMSFDVTELRRDLERKQAERDSAAAQVQTSRAETRIARHDATLERADAEAKQRKAHLKTDVPEDIVAAYELAKDRIELELARERVGYVGEKTGDAARQREAQIERWEHQHARAESSVEQLTAAIDKMSIVAPRDGTVIYETNWRGEKKRVGDSVWRMETVMKIVSLEVMQGIGEVDEVDSSRVAVGQAVSLHLDAQPDVVLRGTVAELSAMVRRQSPDNPLKVAELRIELQANDELRLRPGMRFRGKILTEKVEGAVVVPLDAIVPTAAGPMARKRTRTGFELVPVETGRRNDTLVEIVAGLEVGDELVRGPEPGGEAGG